MQAFYALFVARNREFLRDRGTLAWNFLFPFLVVFALSLIFSGESRVAYKVAVMGGGPNGSYSKQLNPQVRAFLQTQYVQFIPADDVAQVSDKVRRHQFDMALDVSGDTRYWINPSNPKGYFLERVLWGSNNYNALQRGELEGQEIRYVDWLIPGILGMNVMFSCLWGVGYVMVRYRKAHILRRLKASPISAFQFISAQIASRLLLVMFVTIVLFVGMDLFLDFFHLGSLVNVFLLFALGSTCHISLGILIASRTKSQELAGGMLNLATWPMMFLSGVWFSLEGNSDWLIFLARIFPLTHMVDASRKILLDGASLSMVWPEIAVLSVMTAVFLLVGSLLFRWE